MRTSIRIDKISLHTLYNLISLLDDYPTGHQYTTPTSSILLLSSQQTCCSNKRQHSKINWLASSLPENVNNANSFVDFNFVNNYSYYWNSMSDI